MKRAIYSLAGLVGRHRRVLSVLLYAAFIVAWLWFPDPYRWAFALAALWYLLNDLRGNKD